MATIIFNPISMINLSNHHNLITTTRCVKISSFQVRSKNLQVQNDLLRFSQIDTYANP